MPESPDAYVNRTYDQTVAVRRSLKRRNSPAVSEDGLGWPRRLNLRILAQPCRTSSPLGEDFDYAKEFLSLDLDELARDVDEVLTTSQDWWPADFGHYGPLVLRMAWHFAGTYRIGDGRGGAGAGMLRFAPLNSFPDNRNLDKARRLLWPVKKKYGRKISWSDLMIFAGNRALESMGCRTFGFAGGREDAWEADETYWGPESTWLADERHSGVRDLDQPLAASEMGLIYVDPQGPATLPDPLASARDIRETFRRMGMNDEETVALIAGGHTFGKSHGPTDPSRCLGPEPEGAPLEALGLGWVNSFGTGNGADTVTSGLDGIWTATPTKWDMSFLTTLFAYEWDVALSPAGMWQWVPHNGAGAGTVPDPYDPSRTHAPTMLTTDLALQEDPRYRVIALRFLENPDEFADTFARAWFKLTHIDMGPIQRYLGPLVPTERMIWQDPVPHVDHELADADDVAALKREILGSGLSVSQLVTTAWASASTFRNSDKRGGANGARIRLEPQRSWAVNEPEKLAIVLDRLERIRRRFNDSHRGGKQISAADLIVLGGCAAVEHAAAEAGHPIEVPCRLGRTDAPQEWTDIEWFSALEPTADAFRNYVGEGNRPPPEHLLVDRASQLTLTAPQMTVLLGGLRVLGANHGGSPLGVFTASPGALSNDFFVNLLDVNIEWTPRADTADWTAAYEGRDRRTGEVSWIASRVDLSFASDPVLRAISEVYASADAEEKFLRDFVSAWDKVMNLDLFDRT
ncbi:catalase/peroxidase HPI [Mycolicibacterium smegmatis]|uniref:Catalase-peroxidase n=1 Tax=Mycolicibacterium smegmatis (strain MKD8) TaxID=1214915 RepID=A0A2U9PSI4_MYCSE|nr:catalase/peroxidase HPI [Mycolicibacterium smegmatis]AWT54693.1 catalase/peroxidase HPI [Mycolicibacterium smegmatis MKD8]